MLLAELTSRWSHVAGGRQNEEAPHRAWFVESPSRRATVSRLVNPCGSWRTVTVACASRGGRRRGHVPLRPAGPLGVVARPGSIVRRLPHRSTLRAIENDEPLREASLSWQHTSWWADPADSNRAMAAYAKQHRDG